MYTFHDLYVLINNCHMELLLLKEDICAINIPEKQMQALMPLKSLTCIKSEFV